jgi:excinuclease ABC subunit C
VKTSNLRKKVDNLPQVPGSYIFRDSSGKVIYVGKAKNLRSRIRSYFTLKHPSDFKTSELVKRINDIDFIKVDSEFEAVILEAELIKKYRPKYNIVLKDDKSKIYIVIRNEKVNISGKNCALPRVITARKNQIKTGDLTFGSFPNNMVVKNILRTARKIIPFRDCSTTKFMKYKRSGSPCLYGHMEICPAPCVNDKKEELKKYGENISSLKKLLSGKVSKLVSGIEKKMLESSENEEYEEASKYRDLLKKFFYVQKTFREASEYMENPYLIDDISRRAVEEIRDNLPLLRKLPKRIECYDISNISGKEAVGSMVVAVEGKIDISEYKRFKIKFKEKPDNFGMMREVLYRRLRREKKDEKIKSWGKPDLIIVDGGKSQVSAAKEAMDELGLEIPLVGLAKKEETIVYKDGDNFAELTLPKDSYGMKLIIRLRDESHRFAQSYHHLLRKKSLSR